MSTKTPPQSDPALAAQIRAVIAYGNLGSGQFAHLIGMSRSAFYERLEDPTQFKLCELRRISKVAKKLGTTFEVTV